ncbi:MAG: hypothetical protein ACRCYT_06935 [Cetobacterium sp.]
MAKYKQSLSLATKQQTNVLEEGSFKADFKRIALMLDSDEKYDVGKTNEKLTDILDKRVDNNIALPYYFRKLTEEKYEKYKSR